MHWSFPPNIFPNLEDGSLQKYIRKNVSRNVWANITIIILLRDIYQWYIPCKRFKRCCVTNSSNIELNDWRLRSWIWTIATGWGCHLVCSRNVTTLAQILVFICMCHQIICMLFIQTRILLIIPILSVQKISWMAWPYLWNDICCICCHHNMILLS